MKQIKTNKGTESVETHMTGNSTVTSDSNEQMMSPMAAQSRVFVSPSPRNDRNYKLFYEDHRKDSATKVWTDDKTKDQKVQIICKLFPMLSAANVENILTSCACDISKTIDFILSKNLNDSCNSVSMISSAMMFHPGIYSSVIHPGLYGVNTAFGRLRPLTTCPLEALRFPWSTVCNRLPNYNSLPYNPVGVTGTNYTARAISDSRTEEVNGAETEATE